MSVILSLYLFTLSTLIGHAIHVRGSKRFRQSGKSRHFFSRTKVYTCGMHRYQSRTPPSIKPSAPHQGAFFETLTLAAVFKVVEQIWLLFTMMSIDTTYSTRLSYSTQVDKDGRNSERNSTCCDISYKQEFSLKNKFDQEEEEKKKKKKTSVNKQLINYLAITNPIIYSRSHVENAYGTRKRNSI